MAVKDFDSDCWGDPWFQERSRLGRYLFIYLWTNSHCNAAGFYIITPKTICDETNFSLKEFEKLLKELEPKVKYDFTRSICWVVKHARRQFLKSEKISEQTRKGIRKHVLKLCYHPLFLEFIDAYPEIFTQEEKVAFYRPPTGGLGGSVGVPVQVQVRYRSGTGQVLEEIGVQREEEEKKEEERESPLESSREKGPSPHRKFMDSYSEGFKAKFGKKPLIEGKKDGALVKKLLEEFSVEELESFLNKFFTSEDSFVLQSGYTIGVFKSQINKLITAGQGPRSSDDVDRRIFEMKKEREKDGGIQKARS